MRDPKRIPVVLEAIRDYWEKHPELRLAQIIGNAASQAGYRGDGYNMEDSTLLTNLVPSLSPSQSLARPSQHTASEAPPIGRPTSF